MSKTGKTAIFFFFYCLLGVVLFFTLEGASPKSYHFLFGPFLIFKYGPSDAYLGVIIACILFPLLSAPFFMTSRISYILAALGGFGWLFAAEVIRGIAI